MSRFVSVPRATPFTSVIVPTTLSARRDFLLQVLVRSGHHPLCVGATGTAKTITVTQLLEEGLVVKPRSGGGIDSGSQTHRDTLDFRMTRATAMAANGRGSSNGSSSSATESFNRRTGHGGPVLSALYAAANASANANANANTAEGGLSAAAARAPAPSTNRYSALATMCLSARTTAGQVQSRLEQALGKRGQGGRVLGAPKGTVGVVFVDDLNLPAPAPASGSASGSGSSGSSSSDADQAAAGSASPIELLRQWMDHGGWYSLGYGGEGAGVDSGTSAMDNDVNDVAQITRVLDVQLVAAMGHTGGGRGALTPRLLRHFSLLAITVFFKQISTQIV
jgi:hypothetical protein